MKTELATFAAGCFWHVQWSFDQVKGVVSTRVGYTGGHTVNPSYDDVCSDATGHAEAVEITFDPSKVSYGQLLDVFWKEHDPTTPNRQGPDVGSQYRSAIFYHNDSQRKTAERSRDAHQKTSDKRIVTEIVKSGPFYAAEEYHQKYFQKTGKRVCGI
ncbi:peptide-methionine (S)-S-oxide reductase MsrA [Candidatus Woesearchaeota archaeon]|nr:peptide-methionine (S)-S-oxide reductase MsrA [Candidatus Woesearchaeota archaeon]